MLLQSKISFIFFLTKNVDLIIFCHKCSSQIVACPGTKIFKCNAPIYFANIDYLKDQIKHIVSSAHDCMDFSVTRAAGLINFNCSWPGGI